MLSAHLMERQRMTSKLVDLLAQQEALSSKINEIRAMERKEALSKVRNLMHENGLTVADLRMGVAPYKHPTRSSAPVVAKYRNSATGETWSGRGLQPKWLKAALSRGSRLDEFDVAKQSEVNPKVGTVAVVKKGNGSHAPAS